MKNLFAFTIFVFCCATFNAQQPGFAINHDGASPHPYALLELEWAAVPQGFLAPRMTESNLPASPQAGLVIYITDGDFPGFYQYISGEWKPLKHNNFKGFIDNEAWQSSGAAPITGTGSGFIITDGNNIVFNKTNTGLIEVDISAYSFTDPVVQATGRFQIANEPEICNGVWGDGITSQNHLHYFTLTGGGTTFIHFETDETDFTGPIVTGAHGNDRASGYDFDTPLNNPPGRYTYYQNGLDGDLNPIAGWATAAANPDNWPGNDRFPDPLATNWTDDMGSGTNPPEVYSTAALTAGQTYTINVQPFYSSFVEATQPYWSQIEIYIDYNKDGDFSDASEAVYSFSQDSWVAAEFVNFPIPENAIDGKARLRIVVQRVGNFANGGQSGTNPDDGESCLDNFSGQYAGHTYDFDIVITGGSPPYLYDGTFCNVSDVNNDGFTIRCYDSNGEPFDGQLEFNVYDKF
ncbi:MAG: GEVED domain-containing protein [Bacteroidota bacterium]